ncbi:LuxR C-terminal-related transcriptional regulator, partial [Micromonospora sp. MS34]|uniref:LuxR C-terminal-related transcriptional regulator n=1 Tax=Micromonospora sp. MS34 TaxID=3385971 RepID=UPI0039A29D17
LQLLAMGLDTNGVGQRLGMSGHTVTHHISKMLRIVDAYNRTELVARAYAAGVLIAGAWPPEPSGQRCLQSADFGQLESVASNLAAIA